MLGPLKCHPPLKQSLASREWVHKQKALCVGDKLCLVGLLKRFWLLLPFGQNGIIAPMAHLGDEQCMEVFADLQESFRVADTRWHLQLIPPGIIYIFYMPDIWFGKKLVNYCKLHT